MKILMNFSEVIRTERLPLVVVAVVLLMFAAGLAPAAPITTISAQNVGAISPSTGNGLDLYLTNTGTSSVVIGADSFLITTSNSNIIFTSATTGTNALIAPYIFSGHSSFGPTISTNAPGQSMDGQDIYNPSGSGITLGVGAKVGLGHVLFDVLASAPAGLSTVHFDVFATSLSDPSGGNITVDNLVDGSITIINGPVTPEPSSLVLAAIGSIGYGLFGTARRRKRDRAADCLQSRQ